MADHTPRATLTQIAEATGMSVPTVSKVLNGRAGVSAATRKAVEVALAAHHYRPRRRAPAASPQRSVDLVMSGLDGSWPASVASGVEAAAYEAGVHVVISVARPPSPHAARPGGTWTDRLAARGSDGVVLGLVDLTETDRLHLQRHNIPCVMIHPLHNPPAGVASVGANTWAGAYMATEHLIGLGHRDIALVTGPAAQLSEQARIAGYHSAMTAAHLPTPAAYVRHGTYDRASGKAQTAALIGLPNPPTAIFICSDHMAIGGYEALTDAGLRIPADVSIVGFDDLPEARWVYPALTTVRQPVKDMGRAALQLLLRLVNQEDIGSSRLEFATTLVQRQSTQAPSSRPSVDVGAVTAPKRAGARRRVSQP